MLVAALLGLVVGAGAMTAVWLTSSTDADALPDPIPISLETLPDSVLGLQRNDLAARGKSAEQADDMARAATSQIGEYTRAYGGPGIRAAYGALDGAGFTSLMVVNGMQPAPLASSDAQLLRVRQIAAPTGLAVDGSATVRCVVSPTRALVINSDADLAKVKQQVLTSTDAVVTCVRSDRARNVSIELTTSDGEPAEQRARAIAAEIDKLWASVVG